MLPSRLQAASVGAPTVEAGEHNPLLTETRRAVPRRAIAIGVAVPVYRTLIRVYGAHVCNSRIMPMRVLRRLRLTFVFLSFPSSCTLTQKLILSIIGMVCEQSISSIKILLCFVITDMFFAIISENVRKAKSDKSH